MKKPSPQVGLVICFDYLWKSEKRKGRQQGAKDRPCGVIVTQAGHPDRVIICPVTHSEPEDDETGIKLTAKDKAWMGLDNDPQWIITSEANVVDWDDAGIIPVPDTGEWTYGDMTTELATEARADALRNLDAGKLKLISRLDLQKGSPGGATPC